MARYRIKKIKTVYGDDYWIYKGKTLLDNIGYSIKQAIKVKRTLIQQSKRKG